MKRKLIDLTDQRSQHLQAAENALAAGDTAKYESEMNQVTNMNTEIQRVQNLLSEQQRKILEQQPSPAEARDMAEERGSQLSAGKEVKFSTMEVLRAVRNSTTLAAGTLVTPTGTGSNIRDPLGNMVSSIVDQVYVQDLTGMGSYTEPYVISEIDAKDGKVESLAGTARAASKDPVFGYAEIRPYEVNVTSFVDRNISRLSPASYYDKIFGMAMRALRRKLADLIVNGDGQSNPVMFGMKTAKNKAGAAIYARENITAIDANTLDSLYFAYGSGDAMGSNARLFLTKKDLKAIGMLRGTNEKRRLMEIIPDAGNPNVGVIRDGGVAIPYTIVSGLSSLSGATAGAADIQTMLYGDPMNYELGLFGEYSVRVDESVKSVERMYAILGDAMVGGNLVVDKGIVVATLPKAGG